MAALSHRSSSLDISQFFSGISRAKAVVVVRPGAVMSRPEYVTDTDTVILELDSHFAR